MSDQCRHCTIRGTDIARCNSAEDPCSIPESWFVKVLEAEIDRLRERVKELEASVEKHRAINQHLADKDAENYEGIEKLKAECERQRCLHELDHSLADQWEAKNEVLRQEIDRLKSEVENWRREYRLINAAQLAAEERVMELEDCIDGHWGPALIRGMKDEINALRTQLAEARLEIDKRDHWIKARDTLLAEAREALQRVDALIEAKWDCTTLIYEEFKAALKAGEVEG